MGLFKSKDERRIEREMKIRGGLRLHRAVTIREQEKFSEDFIRNARQSQENRRCAAVRLHPQCG